MINTSTPPTPSHNVIFTIPRTASNLIIRLLNLPQQPTIIRNPTDGYFFVPTMAHKYFNGMASRFLSEWTPEEKITMNNVLNSCNTSFTQHVETANAARKGIMIKEHINRTIKYDVEQEFLDHKNIDAPQGYNPTCISDTFLLQQIRPTFLIRHPAHVVPSMLRAIIDNTSLEAVLNPAAEKQLLREVTFHWHVLLYKFYTSSSAWPRASCVSDMSYPIILDAADFGNTALVRKYAKAVGLDEAEVKFEWYGEQEEENLGKLDGMDKIAARMKDTLTKSRGVVQEKLAAGQDLDMVRLKKEWKEEFGENVGARVGRLVEGAMGDYQWLWERRMGV